MNDHTEPLQFDDVKRRLRPGDIFQGADHDWKTQSDRRWKGTCPWHESSSGTCFTVNPDTLEWKCFSCDRGGGPLQYVAELENVGSGARGSLKGQDFFRAWEALARHAGCEGPPDFDSESNRKDGSQKSGDRRPLRSSKKRSSTNRESRPETAKATAGAPSPPRRIQPTADTGPTLSVPESELRKALSRYREALKSSEKARAYVEARGLSVETLRAYGCGFAPAGEWIGQDNAPRLVTPHTTPPSDNSDGRPKLVNLSGRYLGDCDPGQRHRHIGGNPTALFNASTVQDGSGPLVLCEGPLDALSFIEAGHARTIGLHNTDGVPWTALRGPAETLVFAFDRDDTGREDALKRAREAKRRGYNAHTLHDEDSYAGHDDPNEALQAGELTTGYLRRLDKNPMDAGDSQQPHGHSGEDGAAEGAEASADGSDLDADRSPTSHDATTGEDEGQATAADLVSYWNGDNIGHLGRWLWERGGVPEGDIGAGLYADRELHKWIKEQLEAGPGGTTEQDRIRLRWVLWRLYAAHGPEEVPEQLIPIPPMRRA